MGSDWVTLLKILNLVLYSMDSAFRLLWFRPYRVLFTILKIYSVNRIAHRTKIKTHIVNVSHNSNVSSLLVKYTRKSREYNPIQLFKAIISHHNLKIVRFKTNITPFSWNSIYPVIVINAIPGKRRNICIQELFREILKYHLMPWKRSQNSPNGIAPWGGYSVIFDIQVHYIVSM